MVIRILALVVLGVVLWAIWKSLVRASRQLDAKIPPAVKQDDMVTCGVCGVNIPKSDARLVEGTYRCQEGEACSHRKQA